MLGPPHIYPGTQRHFIHFWAQAWRKPDLWHVGYPHNLSTFRGPNPTWCSRRRIIILSILTIPEAKNSVVFVIHTSVSSPSLSILPSRDARRRTPGWSDPSCWASPSCTPWRRGWAFETERRRSAFETGIVGLVGWLVAFRWLVWVGLGWLVCFCGLQFACGPSSQLQGVMVVADTLSEGGRGFDGRSRI